MHRLPISICEVCLHFGKFRNPEEDLNEKNIHLDENRMRWLESSDSE